MNPDTGALAALQEQAMGLLKRQLMGPESAFTQESEMDELRRRVAELEAKLERYSETLERFDTEERMRKAGYTVPLTVDEADELAGMNRQQRRAWAAKRRQSK